MSMDDIMKQSVEELKNAAPVEPTAPLHEQVLAEASGQAIAPEPEASVPDLSDDDLKWAQSTLKEYEELKKQPKFDPNSIAEAIKNGLSHLAPPKPPPAPKKWEKFANHPETKEIWEALSEYFDEKYNPHFQQLQQIGGVLPSIYEKMNNPHYDNAVARANELIQKYNIPPQTAYQMANDEIKSRPQQAAPRSVPGLNSVPAHAKTPSVKSKQADAPEEFNPKKATWGIS